MTSILSAAKFSGTNSNGLSVGIIQSITANEYARITDLEGNETTRKVEPLTNFLVARVQKGYKAGNTVIGGMLTSTNRFIEDEELEFLPTDAITGGLDLLHHWNDKEFFVNAKIVGSYVKGSQEAVRALQESAAHYFQRPGARYLNYDVDRTSLSGTGGKIQVGKGSKGFWKYSTAISWLSPGLELNDMGYMRTADEVEQTNDVSFLITKPVSIFRTLNIGFEQRNSWNFNRTYLGSDGELAFRSEFKNQWSLRAQVEYHSKDIDTRILRGGPEMRMPASTGFSLKMITDASAKFIADIQYQYEKAGNNSASAWAVEPGISVRPFSMLKIGLTATYEENRDELQYVATKDFLSIIFRNRYILGTIEQKTFGLTFRADLNLTPELSVQYYGSPFISRGSYSEFKRVSNPDAETYSDRFILFDTPALVNGLYRLADSDDGVDVQYSIGNPDFNFHQFRSNLVAKWEYRPGSFIYLVWSGDRTGSSGSSGATLGESYKEMRKLFPNNIFLIKLNYWFSL